MKRTVKIKVSNDFPEPITLWLEPWAEDYRMMPKDEFEIIAKNVEEDFYFYVVFDKDKIISAEGQVTDIGIYQNGKLLECGHNREKSEEK